MTRQAAHSIHDKCQRARSSFFEGLRELNQATDRPIILANRDSASHGRAVWDKLVKIINTATGATRNTTKEKQPDVDSLCLEKIARNQTTARQSPAVTQQAARYDQTEEPSDPRDSCDWCTRRTGCRGVRSLPRGKLYLTR
ncbi:hypothetical protein SKAU_G00154230 [Synaphobranchus kaupii]|uniref:Uncharacterized protein n=1 Tax=Synaphobranchus kaupii TaxID=118154 RepID=A0A9Q1FH77_SYNKA|nr:hypothetical protein SKAU_G00154230 [Synaphobranchus kaupii]